MPNLLGLAILGFFPLASAWLTTTATTTPTTRNAPLTPLCSTPSPNHNHHMIEDPTDGSTTTRRAWLDRCALLGGATLATILPPTPAAHALVKGNAPPPKTKPGSDRPKCTNVEECQAMAEIREREEREAQLAQQQPSFVTPSGIRYRDLEEGAETAAVAAANSQVTVYYKVLKLGKRSYDGLSGEGTVIFSRGYGLEDDEQRPGDKAFVTTLGSPFNIVALNDAVVGMRVGGTRRFSIPPAQGWRNPRASCDGGPGGTGTGGDLKTDYLVVPTATMVAEEACLDKTRQPFPISYAQQRRMAQRFDQALIMEVQLVKVEESTLGF